MFIKYFDSVSNTNVGLNCPVDSLFIKKNSPRDPRMLNTKIVTVAVVGSITTFGNKMPLSLIVDSFRKFGKAGDFVAELRMQHLKILQKQNAKQNE